MPVDKDASYAELASKDTTSTANPHVWMDISVNHEVIGRVVIELFNKICPATCENFRRICVGMDPSFSYVGVPFHRIIKGGDITQGTGLGGPTFSDENFFLKHTSRGLVSMANRGPNTNSSQFFFTLAPQPHLDGKHCVFGKITKGMKVLDVLEELEVNAHKKPKKKTIISACGQVKIVSDSSEEVRLAELEVKKAEEAAAKEKAELEAKHAKERAVVREEVESSLIAGLARKRQLDAKKGKDESKRQRFTWADESDSDSDSD